MYSTSRRTKHLARRRAVSTDRDLPPKRRRASRTSPSCRTENKIVDLAFPPATSSTPRRARPMVGRARLSQRAAKDATAPAPGPTVRRATHSATCTVSKHWVRTMKVADEEATPRHPDAVPTKIENPDDAKGTTLASSNSCPSRITANGTGKEAMSSSKCASHCRPNEADRNTAPTLVRARMTGSSRRARGEIGHMDYDFNRTGPRTHHP